MAVTRTGLLLLVFGIDLNSERLSKLLKKASKSSKPLVLVVDDDRTTSSSSSSDSAEHHNQHGILKKRPHHHHDRNLQSRHYPHENNNYHANSNYKSKQDYQPKRQYNKVSYNRHYHDKGLSRGGGQDYHDHHHDHEEHYTSHEFTSRGYQSNKLERLYNSYKENIKGKTKRYPIKDDSHLHEKVRKFKPFRSKKYHHDKHHESEIRHKKYSREDVPRHHRKDVSYSREYEPRERHHLSKQELRREQRLERQRQIALELREYEGLQDNDQRHGLRSGVVKSLLRISNDLMCDAKDECQDDCDEKGKGDDCGNVCEEKFDCDGGEKKTEECGRSDNFCGDDEAEGNPSTRGVPLEPEEDTGCKRC